MKNKSIFVLTEENGDFIHPSLMLQKSYFISSPYAISTLRLDVITFNEIFPYSSRYALFFQITVYNINYATILRLCIFQPRFFAFG